MPRLNDPYSVDFEKIESIHDLCAAYHKIRPILEAAKGFLKIFYPPGAAAIEAIEAVLDKMCPTLNAAETVRVKEMKEAK
jgi:hypothetical protein